MSDSVQSHSATRPDAVMPDAAVHTDHAGMDILPYAECLTRLASVPVGRVGFVAAGEVEILPVNHVVDGQNVAFRTGIGSKLSGACLGFPITFEADGYDATGGNGWSVVIHGTADVVEDAAEARRLAAALGTHGWKGGDRPYWIRIRPFSITGRQLPAPA
jgi:nitroimidazol reductase NimA-like FMN-containing flavoprotein (pyridoxamine 5'-phosphate oxidase superfamily)